MKFKKVFLLVLILLINYIAPIKAEEDAYIVYDNETKFSQTFADYKEAFKFYSENLDNYNNLVLRKNDNVIDMEYGVVLLSDSITDYYSQTTECNDQIIGTYGIDAAYLYTDVDKVCFMISGDKGFIDINEVKLIPYEELQYKLSTYQTSNNELYHNIKTQYNYEYYTSSIVIDRMPSFLENNKEYFNYDGHYFYNDFYLMIDDFRNGEHINAINQDAYYNYYQYLPSRSLSNYTSQEIENYLNHTLNINGRLTTYLDLNNDNATDQINLSQLYGEVDSFINYQNIYGVNALMLLSSAINESNYGRSLNAYLNNNLYANYAYDSISEKENNRYDSIEKSIYAYAKYFISGMYSNNKRSDYAGTFYGNKTSGLNKNYSIDQYYGEKSASIYYKFDKVFDFKDYNSNALGIVNNKTVIFYEDELLENYSFETDINELSLIILETCENAYKVQIDNSFDSDYKYDFEKCVRYVDKEIFDYILNKDKISQKEFITLTYDFDGGNYADSEVLNVKVVKNSMPLNIRPYKQGYLFTAYDNKLSEVSDATTFKANYNLIEEISILSLMETQADLFPYSNLDNAYINIKLEGGTNKKVAINSDMVSKFDSTLEGEQTITVTYSGVSTSKVIQTDPYYYETYNKISKALDEKDYAYIKDNIVGINYPFTMEDIRDIDSSLKEQLQRNYVITDSRNKYNLGISGLDMSLENRSDFIYINDTYYVMLNEISAVGYKTIMNVASGYGFEAVDGVNISFRFNYQNIDLNGPAVVSVDLTDKDVNSIYSVYHFDDDGNVIKCKTSHCNNSVQFIVYESGDYLIIKMPSVNTYNFDDVKENLRYDNMGIDNNRINLELLLIIFLIIFSFIGITFNFIYTRKKVYQWKDYKKSLQKVVIVHEEKQKN